MSRKHQIRTRDLARLLAYILGRRPDEFGLLPDAEGFIAFKELLKAVHEEEGWGHVRGGHIREVLMDEGRTLFEWDETRIRSLERQWDLDLETPAPSPPKVLLFAVRKKAHPHVLEKGLRAGARGFLLLSPHRETALRIGTRRDQRPVILEIHTEAALQKGISFYAFGDLFLAREIPASCLSGPPLPKDQPGTRTSEKPKTHPTPAPPSPGTFVLDPGRDPDPARRHRGKKKKGWKEEVRRQRRRKQR